MNRQCFVDSPSLNYPPILASGLALWHCIGTGYALLVGTLMVLQCAINAIHQTNCIFFDLGQLADRRSILQGFGPRLNFNLPNNRKVQHLWALLKGVAGGAMAAGLVVIRFRALVGRFKARCYTKSSRGSIPIFAPKPLTSTLFCILNFQFHMHPNWNTGAKGPFGFVS